MSLGQLLIAWAMVSVPVAIVVGKARAMAGELELQPLTVRSDDNVVVLRPAAERAAIARARRMHPSCWSEPRDELPALRTHRQASTH
jgi:hypothetical protein